MKKIMIMAVLVALVGQAQAILIDVKQIGLVSLAGGVVTSKVYSGLEQEVVWQGLPAGELRSTGGNVATSDFERASVLSLVTNFEDSLQWQVHTDMYGQGGNAVYMTFSLLQPVNFAVRLGDWAGSIGPAATLAGGILGYGNSGVLGIGDYVFVYGDLWNKRAQAAYGGYQLELQRVPDGGGTLAMLGLGLCGIGFLGQWKRLI